MEMSNDDLDWAREKLLEILLDPEFLVALAMQDALRRQEAAEWRRSQGKPPTPPPSPAR